MSRSILLAPHADDEVLFASFTILRHRPHVVILVDEGEDRRLIETARAMEELGHSDWTQFGYRTIGDALWTRIEAGLRAQHPDPDVVYAPACELGGHEQHNIVGYLARKIYGPGRIAPYLTYTRDGRSRGREVDYEPEWIAMKLRALGCYESQIERESTRPWFTDLLDVREYVP